MAFHTILMIGNKSCRNYKLFFYSISLKLCHQLRLLYTFWYYYWRRLSLFCKVRVEYFREETKTSNPRIREECTLVHTENFSLEDRVRVWQTHPHIYCCCNRDSASKNSYFHSFSFNRIFKDFKVRNSSVLITRQGHFSLLMNSYLGYWIPHKEEVVDPNRIIGPSNFHTL